MAEPLVLSSALVSLIVPAYPQLNIPPEGFASEPATSTQNEDSAELIDTAYSWAYKMKVTAKYTFVLHVLKGKYLDAWIKLQEGTSLLGGVTFQPDYTTGASNFAQTYVVAVLSKIDINSNGSEPYGTITLTLGKHVNSSIINGG